MYARNKGESASRNWQYCGESAEESVYTYVKIRGSLQIFPFINLSRLLGKFRTMYEEESVNRSQMDIKHMIFEPEIKELFLDISSSNIDTLVSSLYQCVATLSHFRASVSTSSSSPKRFSNKLWTALRDKHFPP
jgi:hypothetical protein